MRLRVFLYVKRGEPSGTVVFDDVDRVVWYDRQLVLEWEKPGGVRDYKLVPLDNLQRVMTSPMEP